MSLRKEDKEKIIKEFQTSPQDTASPQVQIALLTSRLSYLNEHFKKNKKDHHSRRGLMKMVGQRRQLLNYLHKSNTDEYKKLIAKLGIRK
jgi:small subunit ribosomal protein S15